MLRRLLTGAAAGAAGTTALHAATYLDMVVRGRAPSTTPEQTVEAMAAAYHVPIPGEGERRDHRVSGLGALSGIATGVGLGTAYGLLDALRLRPHGAAAPLLVAAGAMAVTNSTMSRYGVTRVSDWSVEDWAGDVVPHLAFAAALCTTYSLATAGDADRAR